MAGVEGREDADVDARDGARIGSRHSLALEKRAGLVLGTSFFFFLEHKAFKTRYGRVKTTHDCARPRGPGLFAAFLFVFLIVGSE